MIASFRVSRILAKHKKPFLDGEMVTEAFFRGSRIIVWWFKKKYFINNFSLLGMFSCPEILLHGAVKWWMRIWGNILKKYINECVLSTSIWRVDRRDRHTSRLCIFIRMMLEDTMAKKKCSKSYRWKETLEGRTFFVAFNYFINSTQLPIHKLDWPHQWIYCPLQKWWGLSRLPQLSLHNPLTGLAW